MAAKKKTVKKSTVKKVKKQIKKKVAKKKTPKKVRCAAKTKEGKRCKNWAVAPSKFCYVHKKKR